MRNFISVCLILFGTIYAQQRCDIIRITGTKLLHYGSGRYQILPNNELCSGRQAYKQEGGNYYLFYYSDSEENYWRVSGELCSNNTFLQVYDNATNPENITATWDEVNWISDDQLDWTSNAMIRVMCDTGVFEGCNEVQVTNASYSKLVEGRYQVQLQTSLCSGRYTYKHVSEHLYLYCGMNWYIGIDNCATGPGPFVIHAQFSNGAFYPEDINTGGQESTALGLKTTGLTVQCSGVETIRGLLGLTIIAVVLSLSRTYSQAE